MMRWAHAQSGVVGENDETAFICTQKLSRQKGEASLPFYDLFQRTTAPKRPVPTQTLGEATITRAGRCTPCSRNE